MSDSAKDFSLLRGYRDRQCDLACVGINTVFVGIFLLVLYASYLP